VQRLLRPQDRLVCCEPHPTEFPNLQAAMRGARGVAVASLDGYKALETYLPPKENRGLVFIDPSFELDGEFARLLGAVKLLQQRWRNGMLALWYPILHRAPSARFHESLARLGMPKILCAELGLAAYDSPRGMHGCGMVLLNPPWQLDEMLKRILPVLLGTLGKEEAGQTRVEWLAV
jgi:23S rRNA (adenine2030-N6)-methyltransferase